MSDLMQIVEHGYEDIDGTVRWDRHHQYLVPSSNRNRILNREHENGITPSADGWLYCDRRDLSDSEIRCVTVTRIMWNDARYYAEVAS